MHFKEIGGFMEVIIPGSHLASDLTPKLKAIFDMLEQQYAIHQFSITHLGIVLQDEQGIELTLVDDETHCNYGILEMRGKEAVISPFPTHTPHLRLVVDNTSRPSQQATVP